MCGGWTSENSWSPTVAFFFNINVLRKSLRHWKPQKSLQKSKIHSILLQRKHNRGLYEENLNQPFFLRGFTWPRTRRVWCLQSIQVRKNWPFEALPSAYFSISLRRPSGNFWWISTSWPILHHMNQNCQQRKYLEGQNIHHNFFEIPG